MEIRYQRREFAKLLGISHRHLAEADERPELAQLGGAAGGTADGARDGAAREEYGPRHLSAYRQALGRRPSRRPLRRQLFLNFKGGTGKTSLSVAYAYRLAEFGHRVLMLDLDSQGHATRHLGLKGEEHERTLYDVLVKRVPIDEVLVDTPLAEFDLLPANLGMSTVDLALMPMAGREYRLKKALEGVCERYEYVIMDAPPSFGLLNLNALIAADDLIVPVLPDFLSFHGLKLLFETVGEIEEDLDHTMQQIIIVLNQYNPTTRIAREAKRALQAHYSEFLAKTVVRQCTQFAQASSEGLPISVYAPRCRGAHDIDSLVAEMASVPVEMKEISA